MKKKDAIFRAIEFAAKAHAGQYRKSTKIPYLIHPLGVGKILIDYGCSANIVIAGILHDTVEDTNTTLNAIKRNFGNQVARIAEYVSEHNKTDTWENRKKRTIEHIRQRNPLDVLLVECADKLDNIRAIRDDYTKLGNRLWYRFNRSKKDQQWYYQSLARAFLQRSKKGPTKRLFNEFAQEVKNVFG